jgi:hypothetical protein
MKRVYVRIIVFVAVFVVTLAVLYYTEDKEYYEGGDDGPIEVAVGQTFKIKLDSGPPVALHPCWLHIPDEITLISTEHIKGRKERLKYTGAGDGKDIYIFKAVKEGNFELVRGNCLANHGEGEWDARMKNLDSTVTDVFRIKIKR